jgi:hypothetical protein
MALKEREKKKEERRKKEERIQEDYFSKPFVKIGITDYFLG